MNHSHFTFTISLTFLMVFSAHCVSGNTIQACTLTSKSGQQILVQESVCKLPASAPYSCRLRLNDFYEGMAVFSCLGPIPPFYRGYIDISGKVTIPPVFNSAADFSEGLAAVARKYQGLYGFIASDGQYKIQPRFDMALSFSNGLAPVRQGSRKVKNDCCGHIGYIIQQIYGKWGYINKKGRLVIPAKYDEAREFSEGYAAVRLKAVWKKDNTGLWKLSGGKWGLIDKSGRFVIPAQYDSLGNCKDGIILATKNQKDFKIQVPNLNP